MDESEKEYIRHQEFLDTFELTEEQMEKARAEWPMGYHEVDELTVAWLMRIFDNQMCSPGYASHEVLRVSRERVRQLAHEGKIRYFVVKRRFSLAAFDAYVYIPLEDLYRLKKTA